MNYKVNVSSGDGAPPQPPQSDVAYPIVDCRDYQGDNYVARGAAISDAIVAECKAARDELLTALRSRAGA
jgi:hypothetical protein